jgi:hypothetical protein
MSGLRQEVLLAPDDGSLGPLLRLADDRLAAGAGYGTHAHRAVDVVAVVLEGTLRHHWGNGAALAAGDVALLRAGAGLDHDEVAGEGGTRILQCYLRAADPSGPPTHEVRRRPVGWIDLGRADARLWLARLDPGEVVAVPAGLRVVDDGVTATAGRQGEGEVRAEVPLTVLVWQLDDARPAWAGG